MEETDAQLVARYRKGDAGALEKLVARHRRALFGFILGMTGNMDDAEDVFQEVWLKAMKNIGSYASRNFVGWLIRIGRNTVIDKARKKKWETSLDAEDNQGRSMMEAVPARDPGPSARMAGRDLGATIATAVAGLPVEQREVFLMRTGAEMPFKDIARAQKCSINTALARMQYALAKLREALKDDYGDLSPQLN